MYISYNPKFSLSGCVPSFSIVVIFVVMFVFLLIIIIRIQIWKRGMRRRLMKSQDSVNIGGWEDSLSGSPAWPWLSSLLPAPHTTQLADTLHTQSTKGDPRCQQADFINELLHIEIGMNVTKGAWDREIALSPLYSALLYCLMPSNSVCEDRNSSRCRTSEVQFPCLWVRALKYVWAHAPRWLPWPVLK